MTAATTTGQFSDPDTELMVSVQRNDIGCFEALLNRNRNLVVQYLVRMVRSQAIAEELAQDVFIRVYRSRLNYEPTAKFSTWLYRITTNVALNYFRDQKRKQNDVSLDIQDAAHVRLQAVDHAPLAEAMLVRQVEADQIRRAVQSLPPKQRSAVIMHKYEDMDYARISVVLGCSPAAVKALMFRAHQTLRVRLRSIDNYA